MYYDGSSVYLSLRFVPPCIVLSYPQRPDVIGDICPILLRLYPILLMSLRLFFFCISVVSWTVIYCVLLWTKLFSVKLKPKGVFFFFFSRLLSCFCFTLTENICCMLPLIPIYCWNICLLFQRDTWRSVLGEAFVAATQTQTGNDMERRTWVNCLLFVLLFSFIFLLLYYHVCLFVCLFSQRGVECAIPHTAIYAGQELWHFILCLWEFVSVQAEITCIFQMLYL